jgi:hypothetical protein
MKKAFRLMRACGPLLFVLGLARVFPVQGQTLAMKKDFLTALCALGLFACASSSRAQAYVAFGNTPATRVINALTGQPVFGTNVLLFGLYFGPPGSTELQLSLLSTATNGQSASPTDVLAGRFSHGSVEVPDTGTVSVEVQVRAWSLAAGNTYETAYAAALAGDITVLLGKSSVALVEPAIAPGPPAPLFFPGGPLAGFSVGPIPEPSTSLLALAGIVVLVWLGGRGKGGNKP